MMGISLALTLALSTYLAVGESDPTMLGRLKHEAQAARASPAGQQDLLHASSASYRLSGEKTLRPVRIDDDGVHMYLEWSEQQALPAVFALNALGEEEMVDGYMRQGIFTIDRVYQTLVFRIGKKQAKATQVCQ